jgi:hypothetical protein
MGESGVTALGAAMVALIAHERGEEGVALSHPALEAAFQSRQLERAKVVIAAAGPILTADLLATVKSLAELVSVLDEANQCRTVVRAARELAAKAEGRSE